MNLLWVGFVEILELLIQALIIIVYLNEECVNWAVLTVVVDIWKA